MTHKLRALTKADIKEIAALNEFQRVCKATGASEVERILRQSNTVKWKMTRAVGSHVGVLFVVQTNLGERRSRSRMFFRRKHGELLLLQ